MAMALDVIQPNTTWDILDSTKLTTYMECPRKFFYRYLLGWHTDTPNNHLAFGSAWHIAMEHLLVHGVSGSTVTDAIALAMEYYRREFPPHTDELFEPKTVLNMSRSVIEYARQYAREIAEHEVLHTELGGLVSVSDNRTMAFKCDAILRNSDSGEVYGMDFKTSQRKFANWGDHWTLSTQMLTYLHALHCLYSEADTLRMIVRCTWFYKKSPTEFGDHPIEKSLPQMQAWLERTNQWIDRMESDMLTLEDHDTTDAVVMASYPQNDTACFNFGRQCEFFDFCNAWPNPIARCEQVPIGFRVDWWNPLKRPEIKEVVTLSNPAP